MADDTYNPFATEEAPVSPAPQAEPLNPLDRYILQFIFDSQPKRRAQYLKQKGWQMNEKDPNEIRPMGSTGEFDTEIDPGGMLNFKQYLPKDASTDEIMGAVSETFGDVNEGLLDMIQGAMIEGVGDVAALGAGAVGGPAAMPFGRASGRAMAFNLLESSKDFVGDIILDKDIPPDLKLRTIQTGFQAVAPDAFREGVKLGTTAAKKVFAAPFKLVSQGVKNLLTFGGGKIDDISFDAIKKDPKTFANLDNIKDSTSRIGQTVNGIYGVGPEEAIPNKIMDDSLFQQRLNVLEGQRKQVVSQLSKDSKANPSLGEIMEPLKRQLSLLNDKKVKNEEDKAGIRWLKEQLDELGKQLVRGKGQPPARPESVIIPFSEADEFVKTWQKDLYSKDNPWRTTIRQTIDGGEGVPGVNDLLKAKADFAMQSNPAISQSYAAIKGAEKKVFDAFDVAKRNLTRETAMRRIVGGPDAATTSYADLGIALPGATQAKQEGIDATIAIMDDALGTQLGPALQKNQIQKQIFSAMGDRASKGSSGALAVGIPAFAAGNAVAGPVGGTIAAATAVGLSQPRIGLPVMAGAAQAGQAIEGAVQSAGNQLATQAAGIPGAAIAQEVAPPSQVQALQGFLDRQVSEEPAEEEYDPFGQ